MTASYPNHILLTGALVVSVIGSIDAIVERDGDAAVMFVLVAALLVVLQVRAVVTRPSVGVRRDHLRWLRARAVDGGETVDAVVDRAVGAYRVGLTAPPELDDSP